MADEKKKAGRPKQYKVTKSGAISNGEGGFYEEGDTITEAADLAGLEAKGLIK